MAEFFQHIWSAQTKTCANQSFNMWTTVLLKTNDLKQTIFELKKNEMFKNRTVRSTYMINWRFSGVIIIIIIIINKKFFKIAFTILYKLFIISMILFHAHKNTCVKICDIWVMHDRWYIVPFRFVEYAERSMIFINKSLWLNSLYISKHSMYDFFFFISLYSNNSVTSLRNRSGGRKLAVHIVCL